ncbi:MAG: GNAT family N-acetyltransferase [Planctomycetota bacterium]|nr:GNAT family N-acetyltransferase [Planctomycetota bacterium]
MIRRLTPGDAHAFFRLRLLGLEMHPEAFATGADAWREATPAQVEATLTSEGSSRDRFVLGAFVADELAGLLGFRRERRPSVRHKGSLWGFFVHPDHRRKGLGTGLLRAALDEVAAQGGVSFVRLVVTAGDDDAARVFRAQGFEPYGREIGGLRSGNVFFDQEFMRRDLEDGG